MEVREEERDGKSKGTILNILIFKLKMRERGVYQDTRERERERGRERERCRGWKGTLIKTLTIFQTKKGRGGSYKISLS